MNCPACSAPGWDALVPDGYHDSGDGDHMLELRTCLTCKSTRSIEMPLDYRVHLVNRKQGARIALGYLRQAHGFWSRFLAWISRSMFLDAVRKWTKEAR